MPKIAISANMASQRKSVATKIMDCLAKMGFKNSRKIIGASYDSKDNYSVVLIFLSIFCLAADGRFPLSGEDRPPAVPNLRADVHEPNVVALSLLIVDVVVVVTS